MARSTSTPAVTPIDPRRGIAEAEGITGLQRSTIWRKCRARTFPQPTYIGNRRTWLDSELRAWVAAQAARPASARRGAANLAAKAVAP